MGNANVREDEGNVEGGDDHVRQPNSRFCYPDDLMPNDGPKPPSFPVLFAPQVPAVPLPGNFPPSVNHMGQVAPLDEIDNPSEPSMPALITWTHGGNNVLVEGSWDNWKSRKKMQRSGKDHSILLILPSGVYHYKFVVDGEVTYIPELPHDADDKGHVCNLLDVNRSVGETWQPAQSLTFSGPGRKPYFPSPSRQQHWEEDDQDLTYGSSWNKLRIQEDYVPENPASVAEFEAPPSPDSSYGQTFMGEDDFAKEPMAAPPHVHLTVQGMENSNGVPPSSSFTKPQHTILNHLFIDKGWASRSTIAIGATQRFRSKYVSTVLYKPLKR